jgi:type VI secretion system protein ImpF
MARRDPEQNVTQSILERLIDREIGAPADAPVTYSQSVRQLKLSLRRDLEWLLNARRTPEPANDSFENLSQSLFNFGLPDVTSLNHEATQDRARLLTMLERTIATFEPRLQHIKVTPLDPGRGAVHVLRFQIEGMLMMDPEPEHISFDTVLQLASGQYDVRGGDAGAG